LVKTKAIDLGEYEERVDEIRVLFDRYLDEYPARGARSKHSLMGPIGKVLREAKGGRFDAQSLAGYALNIHMANPKARGYISPGGRTALEEGIAKLYALLRDIPVSARDRLLDRIDYGLYFKRRAKGLQWLEDVRQGFIAFLRERYSSQEQCAAAWGERPEALGADFASVRYPSRALALPSKGAKRDDILAFASQAELKGYEIETEEEGVLA
jgi:hypothetical protein